MSDQKKERYVLVKRSPNLFILTDQQPKPSYNEEIAWIYDKQNSGRVLEAMNLHHKVSLIPRNFKDLKKDELTAIITQILN